MIRVLMKTQRSISEKRNSNLKEFSMARTSNIPKTSASVPSGFPNTEKQMKAQHRRLVRDGKGGGGGEGGCLVLGVYLGIYNECETMMPLPESIDGIARTCELKLLGVRVNEYPCNWDTQLENMLSKPSSRLCILTVCTFYGYSLQELTLLFDSLVMSLFTYAIEVWACAHYSKYLSQIDRFCKRDLRYSYTSTYTPITDLITIKDTMG